MTLKRLLVIILVVLFVGTGFLTGCAPPKPAETENEPDEIIDVGPRFGGTLKVALDGEPSFLDMHSTTATLTFEIAMQIFEGLFTLNEGMDVIPMLAQDYSISEDGKRYTINLRKGIKFHNGKEMTAKDVIASLRRWGELSGAGRGLFGNVNDLYSDGDYTVVFELENPSGVFLVTLAMHNQGAVIYPAEIVEEAGKETVTNYIGTGPYMFAEWRPSQYIKLVKFNDYQSVTLAASGYGGEKIAYVDEIVFDIVADQTVAIAGLETGQYDFVRGAPGDEYERIKDHPNINAASSQFRAWLAICFNNRQGISSNVKFRQAFLAALDMAPILEGYRGDQTFWRLDHSIMFKEQPWWTKAGSDRYNTNNIEKAKSLLEEAGYNGEEIRWIVGYQSYYNGCLVAKWQLEKAGFNINLQLMETGAYSDTLKNPELWDVYTTGFTIRPDPTQMAFLPATYNTGWNNSEVQALLDQLRIEHDFDKRYAMWEKIQEIFYQDVPVIKVGDYSNLRAFSARVQNYKPMPDMYYGNLWLSE